MELHLVITGRRTWLPSFISNCAKPSPPGGCRRARNCPQPTARRTTGHLAQDGIRHLRHLDLRRPADWQDRPRHLRQRVGATTRSRANRHRPGVRRQPGEMGGIASPMGHPAREDILRYEFIGGATTRHHFPRTNGGVAPRMRCVVSPRTVVLQPARRRARPARSHRRTYRVFSRGQMRGRRYRGHQRRTAGAGPDCPRGA